MPTFTPIQVRLPDDERVALDRYRREQENPPSRAQAARQLIRRALSERKGMNADAVQGSLPRTTSSPTVPPMAPHVTGPQS